VRQHKTGTVLAIPINPDLRAELDAMPADRLIFLAANHGGPRKGTAVTGAPAMNLADLNGLWPADQRDAVRGDAGRIVDPHGWLRRQP
jgi:hypothetical protein